MKKLLLITFAVFGASASGFSQDLASANADGRAEQLNKKMARDLQLNNYQQNKLDEINTEVMAKMAAMEQKYKDDPKKQDEACRGVCTIRDQKLENVLSTDQYSEYFRAREKYYQYGRTVSSDNSIAQQVGNTSGNL